VKPTAKRVAFGGPDVPKHKETLHSLKPSIKTKYDTFLGWKARRVPQRWPTSSSRLLPRPSWNWAHSTYSFNKNALKSLTITTEASKAAMRAYLNMIPSEYLDALSGDGSYGFGARAFVSDRLRAQSLIPQSFLGKVSKRPNRFLQPCRELLMWEPAILFKHRSGSRIDTMSFVYDQRIDILTQEMVKMSKQITALL
jgi:hypothetical protein